jgi:hypothetical protein
VVGWHGAGEDSSIASETVLLIQLVREQIRKWVNLHRQRTQQLRKKEKLDEKKKSGWLGWGVF